MSMNFLRVQHVQPLGKDGGDVNGGETLVPFNVVVFNGLPGADLVDPGNVLLSGGWYAFKGHHQQNSQCGGSRLIIKDDSGNVLYSGDNCCELAAGSDYLVTGDGTFYVDRPQVITISVLTKNFRIGDGFGRALILGSSEVYGTLDIRRVA